MLGILHLHPTEIDLQTKRSIEFLRADLANEIPMSAIAIGPGGKWSNIPRAVLGVRSAGLANANIAHVWGTAELVVAAAAGFKSIIFSPQSPVPEKWRKA